MPATMSSSPATDQSTSSTAGSAATPFTQTDAIRSLRGARPCTDADRQAPHVRVAPPAARGVLSERGVQRADGTLHRLLTNAQGLAALAARLRLDQLGVEGDPAVRSQLDRALDALGAREHVEELDDGERSMLLAFARSYLAQGLDLVDDPVRTGAWSYTDPVLLEAQGSASAVVARLIADAGLGSPTPRILDVGTGVGGLAVASRGGSRVRPSLGSIPGSRRSHLHGRTLSRRASRVE